MELSPQERQLWERIRAERAVDGVPRAACSAITPFPFWAVIAAIVIFIPLALVLSFALKRHALLVQGGELVIVELSFWRMRPQGEPRRLALSSATVTRQGGVLLADGRKYHLQPGWSGPAERIVELAADQSSSSSGSPAAAPRPS